MEFVSFIVIFTVINSAEFVHFIELLIFIFLVVYEKKMFISIFSY